MSISTVCRSSAPAATATRVTCGPQSPSMRSTSSRSRPADTPPSMKARAFRTTPSKQGGNKYHGSVYEFFRNTALDTWGFFGPANSIPQPASPSSPSSTATSTASISVARSSLSARGATSSSSSATTAASATPARPRPHHLPHVSRAAGDFQGGNRQSTSMTPPRRLLARLIAPTVRAVIIWLRSRHGDRSGWQPGIRPARQSMSFPASEFSTVAQNLQSFIPARIGPESSEQLCRPERDGPHQLVHH